MARFAGTDTVGMNVYVGDVVQNWETNELFAIVDEREDNVSLSVGKGASSVRVIKRDELKKYKLRACGTLDDMARRHSELRK